MSITFAVENDIFFCYIYFNMKIQKSILIFILSLTVTSFVFSQEQGTSETRETAAESLSEASRQADEKPAAESAEQEKIADITIEGLKKTRPAYMQRLLAKYKGMNASEVDTLEVETLLHEQNLFSETDVEIRHNENKDLELHIVVKEKISFLPLPFIAYSSKTGVMGGLMLMDTNAFGVKDNYVVGGIFSKSMQMGVMAFSKPSLSRTQPGFSISGNFAHRNNEFQDSHENKVMEYNSIGGGIGLTVTDKLTTHTSLSAGLRYAYRNIDVDSDFSTFEDELKTHHAFTVNAGWGLSLPTLNDWFLSTKSIRINADATFFTTGEKAQGISAQISLQQPLPVTRLRLLAQVSVVYTHDANKVLWPSQTAVGITIMPSKFYAPQMGGFTCGLEVGLVKTAIATFSVYGLYEGISTKDWDDTHIIHQGYSAGAKMYLAKISLPAMAMGFYHNVTTNRMKFSVSAGVSY